MASFQLPWLGVNTVGQQLLEPGNTVGIQSSQKPHIPAFDLELSDSSTMTEDILFFKPPSWCHIVMTAGIDSYRLQLNKILNCEGSTVEQWPRIFF